MRPAFLIVIAYLLGSIPFGYLIVRATQGADVRETGSGGTGATNVSRRAGKTAGVLTLFLDALKGVAAVVIAKLVLGLPIMTGNAHNATAGFSTSDAYWWLSGAAIAVILGHIFPIWLRFRGGKGVATGVGVFLMLTPMVVGIAVIVFLVVVVLTRYVSMGSILAAITIPVFLFLQSAFFQTSEPLSALMTAAIAGAALIVFAHRQNISRLLSGTETKFK